jgi:hypothetical protein
LSWATPASGSGNFTALPVVTPLSGWYVSIIPARGDSTTTQIITLNTAFTSPYVCPANISINQLAIVVTGVSAGFVNVGIYESGANGWPVSTPIVFTSISTAVLGTATATVSVNLTKGSQYWFCIQSNSGSATLRAISQLNATVLRSDVDSTAYRSIIRYGTTPGTARNFTTNPVQTTDVAFGNLPILYARVV